MTKTLLAMESFKPEQLTYLHEQYPNLKILNVADLNESNICQINIIYGYRNSSADEPVLKQLLNDARSHLEWLQTISAGVDYLPFKDLANRKILISNASGIHANSIAQNVFGYLLYWSREIDQAVIAQKNKHFGIDINQIRNLDGQTILIFDTGHIGQKIAELAQAFGMRVNGVSHSGQAKTYFDTIATDANYHQLVEQADVLVNTMPLTAETKHFFNTAFFDQLGEKTPIFVNVGRGPSVDESALTAALNTGKLQAAALDVFEQEPLSSESPLWKMPNVLITPHTSGIIEHFRNAFFNVFKPNLASFMKNGTLVRNQVDLQREY